MPGNAVNAFGKLNLETTQDSVQATLEQILIELRIINRHLAHLSDFEYSRRDVEGD